jgi:hypothetical protein
VVDCAEAPRGRRREQPPRGDSPHPLAVREPADVTDLTAATFVEPLTSALSYDSSRAEPEACLRASRRG